MNRPMYFRSWLEGWRNGVLIVLVLLLLSTLVQFGAFALTQQYVISYFWAQPEDVSFALQITYAAIIAILPIQFRLIRRFETKPYYLTLSVLGILLTAAMEYTTDIYVFMLLRLFTGLVVCCLAGCVFTLVLVRLANEHKLAVGSSVFYGSILSNGVLIGLVAARITENADWKLVYHYLLYIQAGALLLAMLVMNPKVGFKRYPLYQIDWISFVLALTGMITIGYLFIYGPKYEWYEDRRILWSTVLVIATMGMFIVRQLTRKRPYLDLRIFRYRNFIMGLLLLLLFYGVKDSINLVFTYGAAVVRWNTTSVILLALVNLGALITGMAIAATLILRKRHSIRFFLLTGFGLLLFYHLWLFYTFTPDLAFQDLIIPILMQGLACGILFVPVVAFMVSALPVSTGFAGIQMAAVTRFVATLNSIAGFYTLQLYYNQYNKEVMLRHLSGIDGVFNERLQQYTQLFQSKGYAPGQAASLAYNTIARSITVQGQLMTNKQIFWWMALLMGAVMVIVWMAPHLNDTWLRFSKRRIPLLK